MVSVVKNFNLDKSCNWSEPNGIVLNVVATPVLEGYLKLCHATSV